MSIIKIRTTDDFYKNIQAISHNKPVPEELYESQPDIGHFNVFDIAALYTRVRETNKIIMPYNRRAYYKISLIRGHNIAEFADKTIDIRQQALTFATPRIPYHWYPQSLEQAGYFCIFSDDFFCSHPESFTVRSSTHLFSRCTACFSVIR